MVVYIQRELLSNNYAMNLFSIITKHINIVLLSSKAKIISDINEIVTTALMLQQ